MARLPRECLRVCYWLCKHWVLLITVSIAKHAPVSVVTAPASLPRAQLRPARDSYPSPISTPPSPSLSNNTFPASPTCLAPPSGDDPNVPIVSASAPPIQRARTYDRRCDTDTSRFCICLRCPYCMVTSLAFHHFSIIASYVLFRPSIGFRCTLFILFHAWLLILTRFPTSPGYITWLWLRSYFISRCCHYPPV
jgi:hypothetical protein